ncbi:hypothetical protein M0804_007886 [Polistes exclamans]|nr:hypothetical protein M0804_007886 [Polistes exclamans]
MVEREEEGRREGLQIIIWSTRNEGPTELDRQQLDTDIQRCQQHRQRHHRKHHPRTNPDAAGHVETVWSL